MITVAIAGGTSPGLGRSILTALAQYPDQLKGVVLGRGTSKTPQWLEVMDVEVRKVDYGSEDSLFEALKGVHTVICTLLAKDGTWTSSQLNLLRASLRAGISRFAPAEFGVGPLAAQHVDLLRPQIAVMEACREAKRSRPDFEYAGFHPGLFMNYLGYGAKDEEGAMNGLNDRWVCIWDVGKMTARIPLSGTGKVPRITLTEIGDVGRFVAAACLLPRGEWREDFSMVGETLGMDEVVSIVEEVRGRRVDVVYRPFEQVVSEMERQEVAYPDKFWGQLEVLQAKGRVGESVVEPVLNGVCGVEGMRVREYVQTFWG